MKRINLLLIVVLLSSCGHKSERLKRIAIELLVIKEITDFTSNWNRPVADVVNIGPRLYEILSNRKTPIDSIKIKITKEDFFEGNQGVTHSILYSAKNSKLRLRMRFERRIDSFHIVGYSGRID